MLFRSGINDRFSEMEKQVNGQWQIVAGDLPRKVGAINSNSNFAFWNRSLTGSALANRLGLMAGICGSAPLGTGTNFRSFRVQGSLHLISWFVVHTFTEILLGLN